MFIKLSYWFKKPYYFNESNSFKLKVCFIIGLLVFILLNIFKPVELKNITINIYLIRLLVSLITVINLLFFFFVITKWFPNFFSNNNWTVGKHFTTIITLIFFSSVVRWLFVNYLINQDSFKAIGLFEMVYQSFKIGIIPTLIFIYLDERYHYNKYKGGSDEIMTSKKTLKKDTSNKFKDEYITVFASNKKENITFKISDLIYVISESNYACFYIKNGDVVKEYILRLQLKVVEKELAKFNNIIRCHKSYIINKNYIINISGNARGYFFNVKNVDQKIPVSRRFSKKEVEKMI